MHILLANVVAACACEFRSIVDGAANDDTLLHLEFIRRQQPPRFFSRSQSFLNSVTGHFSLSLFDKILLTALCRVDAAAAAPLGLDTKYRGRERKKLETGRCTKTRYESIDFPFYAIYECATRDVKNTRTKKNLSEVII